MVERQVVVGGDLVALGEALVERALEAFLGLLVPSVLVLLEADAEGLLPLAGLADNGVS